MAGDFGCLRGEDINPRRPAVPTPAATEKDLNLQQQALAPLARPHP